VDRVLFLSVFRKTFMLGCLTGGPISVILAIALGIHTVVFLDRSVSAQGTIIGLAPIRDSNDNSLAFTPIFSFGSTDGIYTVTSNTGSNPPEFAIGQRLEVRYDKNHPASARIASFRQLWLLPMAFGILGILASLTGLLLPIFEHRRVAQPALY
jgi:hypothetical protein